MSTGEKRAARERTARNFLFMNNENQDLPETERRASAEEQFSDVFDKLAGAVKESHAEKEVYFDKMRGFLVWKDGQGELAGVILRCYRRWGFRLSSRSLENESLPYWFLPSRLGEQIIPDDRRFPNLYGFELTFVLEDVPEVARNFIAFTGSAFNHPKNPELIWKWPLFASDQDFPWFAWSDTAENAR